MTITCAWQTIVTGTKVDLINLVEGFAIVGETLGVIVGGSQHFGAVTWRADNQPIVGETGPTLHIPAGRDGQHVTAQVGDETSVPALVQQAAPTLVQAIPAQSFKVGDGTVTLAVSNYITGGGLTVTVEPGDGVVEIEGDAIVIRDTEAIDETIYTIHAQNSGGLIQTDLTITIAQTMNRVIDFLQGETHRAVERSGLAGAIISPTDLASTELWLALWMTPNGTGGRNGLFSIGRSSSEYFGFQGPNAFFRNGDLTTSTPSVSQAGLDPYSWSLIAGGISGTASGGRIRHWFDGAGPFSASTTQDVAEIATAFDRIALGRFHAYAAEGKKGACFDAAVMVGNATAALAWAWNDGINVRSLGDYDFARDPNCDLIALYPLQSYGAPNDPVIITTDEVNTVMTNVVLPGDPRAGGRTPIPNGGWTKTNSFQWGKQRPWQVIERLDITEAPSISVSGDTFTLNTGLYNAAPGEAITVQPFWNGVPVAMIGNTYSRPSAEAGQFVAMVTVDNGVQKHQFTVYDNTFVPGLGTGTGDDDAITIMTTGLARDEFFFVLPSPQPMGYFEENGVFVVGTCDVTRYPLPELKGDAVELNGSMKNLIVRGDVSSGAQAGFDSRVGTKNGVARYNAALNVTRPGQGPVALVPSDCLIAGLSDWAGGRGSSDRVIAVGTLHCVTAVPKWDAFRPGYSGGCQHTWRYADINPARIPSLDHTPVGASAINPDVTSYASFDRVRRVALMGQSVAERSQFNQRRHMVHYAGSNRRTADMGHLHRILVSNNTVAAKRDAIRCLVQHGIDVFCTIMAARARDGSTGMTGWFGPDGWWNASAMAPPVIAGHLLGDDTMRDIAQINRFQEIGHTFFVTQEQVTISNQPLAPIGTRYSVGFDTGRWYPYPRSLGHFVDRIDTYKPGMIAGAPMPEWGSDNNQTWRYGINADFTAHQYRRGAGAHSSYSNEVLALLACDLRGAINHEPYFQYHIRHVEIEQGRPDPWQRQGGSVDLYPTTRGTPQNSMNGIWAETMRLHHFPIVGQVPW